MVAVVTAGSAPSLLPPLPRGRHGLSRDQVRSSQRQRLLRAAVEEVAERGYASSTAAGVYGRAGVSSRAFYDNFRGLPDCYLAAYKHCADVTTEALREGAASTGLAPLERFGRVLSTYLRLLADEPAIARTFLVEVYAAGPAAIARRVEVHQRFVTMLVTMLAPTRAVGADDRAAVVGLVDAITFAVTLRTAAGSLGDLRELHHDLLILAQRLCPWLSPKATP